jgi:hypothetical protein
LIKRCKQKYKKKVSKTIKNKNIESERLPLQKSSFSPATALEKCLLAVLAAKLGTPRGRCDEHSGKFPSIVKPRFNRPVGERNHF